MQIGFAGSHPISVAHQGIDFTVVCECMEGVARASTWKRCLYYNVGERQQVPPQNPNLLSPDKIAQAAVQRATLYRRPSDAKRMRYGIH